MHWQVSCGAGCDVNVHMPAKKHAIAAWNRRPTESRARLEGAEIAREAAARAVEDEHLVDPQTADDDAYDAALIHAAEAIRALDLPAILAEQCRTIYEKARQN